MRFPIDIPDAQAPRILDALASYYGYNAERDGSKAQFVRQCLTNYIKAIVSDVEGESAAQSAREVAHRKVRDEIEVS